MNLIRSAAAAVMLPIMAALFLAVVCCIVTASYVMDLSGAGAERPAA